MTMPAASPAGSLSRPIESALALPNGARFYRCALQVNPFDYLNRHHKSTTFQSEEDYNRAIIDTCLEIGVEVIAVTDHYRVRFSRGLVEAARAAGLWSFSGFEAVAKDGVHILCLFGPDQDDSIERFIGDCGVHKEDVASPVGDLDSLELLERSRDWGAVAIAAHMTMDGGLLTKLSGQPRINAWRSEFLLAGAIPGPVSDVPGDLGRILENRDSQHKRDRLPALINASDVTGPESLRGNGASCSIKMSHVSVEGLRQAFLDPASRVRLNSDPKPGPHAECLAMTWEGGFLDGTSVHWNSNLNALIGGRGTGKSTVVESIRYALGLDPMGDEARKAHEGVIRHVLRSGTKVSLLVQSHKPSKRRYVVERSVPNPPVVKDETGQVLTLSPRDVMPGVEVFGQHEISELTKSPEKLTLLLERFAKRDPSLLGRKAKLRLELEKSRSRIASVRRETQALDERLAVLPGLEEMQRRFRQAGLEERLRERSLVVREERLFSTAAERLEPFHTLHSELTEDLPIDTAFVSARALESLPNADILSEMEPIVQALSTRLKEIGDRLAAALSDADRAIDDTRFRWGEKRKAIEENYERLLRELQKSEIDGAEFIRLRQQIEELRPLKDKIEVLRRDLAAHEGHRRSLLAEWEDHKLEEHLGLERAAKVVSRKLRDRVQVTVQTAGNRGPLENLIRQFVGGNLKAALDRLRALPDLSLPAFAQCCREGKDSLRKQYSLPMGAAEGIARADPDLFMQIEELELLPTTKIELNTAAESENPVWRTLQELSTGQKATAVLLLLLLESEAPLVVDQPEDDLDNRFITEGVVPIMRKEKQGRQFVFSTHNANIPVLGDAELILGLGTSSKASDVHAKIAPEHMGSIDSASVRELVEETLEGGKAAFEMRRSKYGF